MDKSKTVVVKNAAVNTLVHFLGVWLTRRKGCAHTIKMCRDFVKNTTFTLEKKHVTLAHTVYIFNTVVIPRVLYLIHASHRIFKK